jgi:glyoxylase-like metal-dependent hydrolase (beta-lactamase superfamily II)
MMKQTQTAGLKEAVMLRLLSTLALLFLTAAAQAGADIADYPMQAQRVADGVYAIVSPAQDFPNEENLGWNSNAAFVETDEGLLVFDTGSSETIGKALLQTIRTVSDAPIKWVINSHSHGDHWLGNGPFAQERPAEMIASDVAIELMEKMGLEWVDRFNNMTGGATGSFKPVPAKDAVTEAMARDFGGVEVQILFSGNSHSPGDIVFWLPQKRVLLTGDTMYTQRPPATFDADVQQWIAFLEKLGELEPEVVIPGHGPVAGAESITQLHDYFDTLWSGVAAGYDEGLMDYEIAPKVKAQMKRFEPAYPGLYERLGESVSHVYLQVEAAMF